MNSSPRPRVRSLFLSDIHLGTRACQADKLLDVLRVYSSQHLFLIGDILDFWAMSRSVHWTTAQNTVVQKILRRARHGDQVIFIPGNHDEALRSYLGISMGDIRVEKEWEHRCQNGQRLLLIHGDEFDQVTRYHRWLAVLGDAAYQGLVRLNGVFAFCRRVLHRPGYWSLAGYAKQKVKKAIDFIFAFEDAILHEVRHRQLDGVVCGHIHWAALKQVNGLTYANCGDWVDSCTAVVEHWDGTLEIVRWSPELAESSSFAGVAA